MTFSALLLFNSVNFSDLLGTWKYSFCYLRRSHQNIVFVMHANTKVSGCILPDLNGVHFLFHQDLMVKVI